MPPEGQNERSASFTLGSPAATGRQKPRERPPGSAYNDGWPRSAFLFRSASGSVAGLACSGEPRPELPALSTQPFLCRSSRILQATGVLASVIFIQMQQYLELMRHVLEHGTRKTDRTGTGTLSVFGWQMRFDLAAGFPLLTTKKLHTRSIIHELLWFLRGETNVRSLREQGVTIWDEWADADGELGPVYGYQWRHWPDGKGGEIDQLRRLIDGLKSSPDSRRHIVTAWNPADLPRMALPPCHLLFQFHVADGRLSCQLYQRSADIFLGVPFNIASYALLTHMVAQVVDLVPGEFIHTLGDAHLYLNHLEQARLQLTRTPRPLPTLRLDPSVKDLFAFRYEHITIEGYDPHPHIAAPVAV